ncbi:hypothetical protein ACIGW8_10160 [Streptomyces sioyaensis]|uniref:hypothetical protein n=1 Tax=Streptomyces sioyaensis TaxID=67364 RepID=UPI0037D182EE
MIRIVTRTRLAALQQDANQARERTREVQAAADAAYACHVRAAWNLTAEAEDAERAAETARARAEELAQSLERLRAELVKARGTVAEQAARIEALRAPAPAGSSMVLLLHYGRPHSIHPDKAAAYAYAATLGVPLNGWVSDERPAAEVWWRCEPFIYDAAADHFRSVVAPSVEPVGGAG